MDRNELIKIAESNVLPHYAIVSEIREKEPKIIVKGKGAKIYDIDDKEYIDGLSILWTVNIGHGRQEIIDALKEQLEKSIMQVYLVAILTSLLSNLLINSQE